MIVTENEESRLQSSEVWREKLKVSLRELKYTLYTIRQSSLMIVGLTITIFILCIAILAPLITVPNTPDPYQMKRDYAHPFASPGTEGHPLGTGERGADVFYGLIWGSRISLWMGLSTVVITSIIGIVVGGTCGYFEGKIDAAVMRVVDVFLSIPSLMLAIVIAVALGPSLINIVYAIILVFWPRYTRIIRGNVITVKQNLYIEASRALGANTSTIIFRHILPNAIAPLLVQATMDIGYTILVTASLGYIGLGQPGVTEWGVLVSEGQANLVAGIWWPVAFPGLFIFLFVLGFNLMGDGLRDIMDPRLRRKRW